MDAAAPSDQSGRRKRPHRAGKKKKRSRRKSFASTQDNEDLSATGNDFYSNHRAQGSATSLESQALLDHRDQQPLRPRRPSIAITTSSPFQSHQHSPFQAHQHTYTPSSSRLRTAFHGAESVEDDDGSANEGAPLLSQSVRLGASETAIGGGYGTRDEVGRSVPRSRAASHMSLDNKKKQLLNPVSSSTEGYNVNYPPSMPGSPRMRPSDPIGLLNFGDELLRDEISRSEVLGRADHGADDPRPNSSPLERRHTICLAPEEDVCFPQDGMSEIGDDMPHPDDGGMGLRAKVRRRKRRWPDLTVLEEWSHIEKEEHEERRVKRITEPQLINGRLRPVNKTWFKAEDDAPYRFTYFNEEFQSTVHSQTISGLVQAGGSFRELFVPDPIILEDSSSEEDEEETVTTATRQASIAGYPGDSRAPSRQTSLPPTSNPIERPNFLHRTLSPTTGREIPMTSVPTSGMDTPVPPKSPASGKKSATPPEGKPVRFGERPVWWLDILSPTETEMRVISKAFGIHPLTAEDIIMQEAREKVELFRHYYFVNYRTFDQDEHSENYLEPVNMYVVVFREGILTFHFSITPHPANVRRRVRQLRDYMMLSADWISYAIIDDITDVFVPLITNIEEEVDDIDDEVLGLHSDLDSGNETTPSTKSRDNAMLRRIGDCRKKVMGLYRLLGNKADVIKGFAKRCNEHWEVAPRSDIGLYLGDIQDHIVTMTANLSHYEKILARSHANYLAQISLRMNERQEETADILGKLTILGTIVLPMNLVTGLWGMNVWVPGQDAEGDLRWFFWITTCLITAGLLCYWVVKRMYGL